MMTAQQQMQARSEGPVNAIVRGALNAEIAGPAFEFAFRAMLLPVIPGGLMALPVPAPQGWSVAETATPGGIMSDSDRAARDAGFTRRIYAEGGCEGGDFLIHPQTDLDDHFKAWALDWQQWTWITGSNCHIEEVYA